MRDRRCQVQLLQCVAWHTPYTTLLQRRHLLSMRLMLQLDWWWWRQQHVSSQRRPSVIRCSVSLLLCSWSLLMPLQLMPLLQTAAGIRL